MVGVKGRSGGARPGAGGKKKTTVTQQATRRSIVLEVFEEDAWRETVKAWLVMAKDTPSVIYPLLPYILGGAKSELHVTGEITHVKITEIRQALGIVDIRELPAKSEAG